MHCETGILNFADAEYRSFAFDQGQGCQIRRETANWAVFFRPVALFFLELLFPPIGLFLAILRKMKKKSKIKKKLRKTSKIFQKKKKFRNFGSFRKYFEKYINLSKTFL